MPPPYAPGTKIELPDEPSDLIPSGNPRSNRLNETAVAVDAALAADRAQRAEREVGAVEQRLVDLETRVLQLEGQRGRSAPPAHRVALVTTILGTVGSLIVGVILWALNFATTVEANSVKQARVALQQDLEKAQVSAVELYGRGAREGAEQALAKLHQSQQDQGLVVSGKPRH